MKRILKYSAFTSTLATILIAGPAFAISGYSTSHLNLRSGPGTQYPAIGILEYNVRTNITGCLADYSWCSVTVAGLSGWVSAEYLVVDGSGQIMHVDDAGASTGIPVVVPEGIAEVVAPATVGVIIGANGHVAAVVPEAPVLQYISATSVPAVAVQGEVVVGAVLPSGVQLYEVPGSPYAYAIVNGMKVLVEPNARSVVYIHPI